MTHINAWAESDQVQHVLDVTCWCAPAVTEFGGTGYNQAHTVVDHAGKPQRSVLKVPVLSLDYNPIRNTYRTSSGWTSARGDS